MKTNVQETSINVYHDEIKPKLGEKQLVVLAAFETRESFTNLELSHYLGWPINTITPRVFELRKVGRLIEKERRICTKSGYRAIAWQLVKEYVQQKLF